jgi:hypothetical protein
VIAVAKGKYDRTVRVNLSDDQVRDIRRKMHRGITYDALRAEYKCSIATLTSIKHFRGKYAE